MIETQVQRNAVLGRGETPMHDLVIRNGSIVYGTGGPARQGNVAVDGDRITSVGEPTGVLPGQLVRGPQGSAQGVL